MVARSVDHLIAAGIAPILVVTGHRADDIRTALTGRDVRFVHADRYQDGLAESLKAGLAALPEDAAAVMVCLADMPLVEPSSLSLITAAYDPDEGRLIVVPTHAGRQGNPVLWDRSFVEEMMTLSGDVGARSLLKRHMEAVAEVEIPSDSVLRDFDTPESLASLPG